MESTGDASFRKWKKAMHELSSGRDYTKKLIAILKQPKTEAIGFDDDMIKSRNESTKNLMKKIMESLNESISILTPSKSTSSIPLLTYNNVESDEFIFFSQSQSLAPLCKDRRGCHKRQSSSEILTEESLLLADDGHAWRKYGQKQIRDAKHPRDYFRCTYSSDQDCKATKQLQKIQDNPPKYRITYFGNHTCNNKIGTSPETLSCDVDDDSSISFNFKTSNITCKKPKIEEIDHSSMFPSPSTEHHQCDEESIPNCEFPPPFGCELSPEDIMMISNELDVPMSPWMSMDSYEDISPISWG